MEKDLTRKQSQQIQGLAIIFMLFHHMFLNPDFIGRLSFSETVNTNIVWFARICVGLFSFISGYGIYYSFHKYDNIKTTLKNSYIQIFNRVAALYIKMWLILIPFKCYDILIAGERYSFEELIKNALGISVSYNGSWWYVLQYVCMIILVPVLFYILDKDTKVWIRAVSGVVFAALSYLFNMLNILQVRYLLVFMVGFCCARFAIFGRVKRQSYLSIVALILSIAMRVVLIKNVTDASYECVIVPVFVYGVAGIVSYIKPLQTVLQWFGKHSTYMWLVHLFIMGYFEVALKKYINSMILYFGLFVAVTVAVSLLFEGIEALLRKCWKQYMPHSKVMICALCLALFMQLAVQYESFSLYFDTDEDVVKATYMYYDVMQDDNTNVLEFVNHRKTDFKRRVIFNREYIPCKVGLVFECDMSSYTIKKVNTTWLNLPIYEYELNYIYESICDTVGVEQVNIAEDGICIDKSLDNAIVWYDARMTDSYLTRINDFTKVCRIIELVLCGLAVIFGIIKYIDNKNKPLH